MVRMPSGPLKQVGEHPVSVALHTDVTAHITVHVVGETVVRLIARRARIAALQRIEGAARSAPSSY